MPLLATEALHLAHRQPLHPDRREAVLHLIELERLDDRTDPLHARPGRAKARPAAVTSPRCNLHGVRARAQTPCTRLLNKKASPPPTPRPPPDQLTRTRASRRSPGTRSSIRTGPVRS